MTAMTSTPADRPNPADRRGAMVSARWVLPVHITGAALLGAIGLAHLLMVHVFDGEDTPAEAVIDELSLHTHTSIFDGGRQVSVFGLNTGYSVGMGMFGLLFALMVIAAVRAAPQLVTRWSLFTAICLTAAAGTFWIACLYFPEVVIALSGLATLCFAAVLVGGPQRNSELTARRRTA